MADDLEALNRVRIAMGYDPLPAPGAAPEDSGLAFKSRQAEGSDEDEASTVNTRQAQGGENWAKLEAKREAEQKRIAQKEAIRRERERAALNKRLEGQGLADADADLDAGSWIAGTKKRQKKIEKERARRLADELAEREREAQEEYSTTDLAGLKVGHELGDFDEGDQVLTLKDTAVDDSEDEDQLENATLKDREMLKERLETKKRKRAYDPNDVNDDGSTNVLGQYDEEINGKKKSKVFTLDAFGSTAEDAQNENAADGRKGVKISLGTLIESTPISDYAEATEVKIKKPKKKKSKHLRKKALDDDDLLPANGTPDVEGMEIDNAAAPKKILDNDTFDDDDLQSRLARQRRDALKKRKKTRPEDIAKQIREEASATPDVMETVEDGDNEEEPGLVIDETSRFVANLEKLETPEPAIKSERASASPDEMDTSGDIKRDIKEEDVHMGEDGNIQVTRATSTEIGDTGLDEEKTVSSGVGAAMTLLRQRGLIAGENGEGLNEYQRKRQQFLSHKQRSEEEAERRAKQQRDNDRSSGRLDHMSTKEKEERARNANANRDVQDSRRLAEMYSKEYRPNVELKYHDEHGRSLDQKEAFKHLSHQFHGKGSGKGKTEKRLKKIEDEKKRMAQSSLDSSDRKAMNYNAASHAPIDGGPRDRPIK